MQEFRTTIVDKAFAQVQEDAKRPRYMIICGLFSSCKLGGSVQRTVPDGQSYDMNGGAWMQACFRQQFQSCSLPIFIQLGHLPSVQANHS